MSLTKALALACATLIPTTALANWNGWYGGVSVGQFDNSELTFDAFIADEEISDSDTFGGYIGTLTQNGSLVYGGEIEFISASDAETVASGSDVAVPIVDIKGRIGYAAGNLLPYAVVSLSSIGIDDTGIDITGSGFGFGAGVDFMVADRFIVGVEYLSRDTNGEAESDLFIGTTDFDITGDTVSLRLGYKF